MRLHSWFFTWGLNYGNADCKLPWSSEFAMTASPPPVVLDMWDAECSGPGTTMTTVGNWRQQWRNITVNGETYRWSKHHEFLKIIELPERVARPFELALASYEPSDQELLESHGWSVRPATTVSQDSQAYRSYICASRGEFSVAKDQNVRLRSGWFSERSACYLAAGRPVVLQDTAFGNFLPSGEGVLSFTDLDSAAGAIESLNTHYQRHRRAARDIAREYLDSDVVLRDMLAHCGVTAPVSARARLGRSALPHDLELTPQSRRPLVLNDSTTEHMTGRPVPSCKHPGPPRVSIVMVTHGNLAVTRMAAESILASSAEVAHELIVVDNCSTDGTRAYLEVLASRNAHVQLIANPANAGFAKAVNQGLTVARGEVLVVTNNDVIVTPSWLTRMASHLNDSGVGAVGPVTNRCGNHAEIPAPYRTYGEMLAFDAERAGAHSGVTTELPMLVMFCMAMKRAVFELIGALDERFEIGMFEDDDYGRRIIEAGLRLICAEDVFVHHFGEAAFSKLYANGDRSQIFAANRRRFEEKWGVRWEPHRRRPSRSYERVVEDVRDIAAELIGGGAVVSVISKGDEQMVRVPCGNARHFPGSEDGAFVWFHPADDDDAISALIHDEQAGLTHLLCPEPAFWWLDHYAGFRRYLAERYEVVPTSSANVLVFQNLHPADAVDRCASWSSAS
jgi:GT2 family glycosyltransferase